MCHSVRKPSSSHKLLPSKGRYHDAADVACLPLLLLQQSGYCGRSLSGHLHGHDLSSSISVNAERSSSQSAGCSYSRFTYAFTRRCVLHAHTLSHTNTFTHRRVDTDAFTHRRFYTQTLLHTDAFTHKSFYTQTVLHTDASTRRRFYTQMRFTHAHTLSHTNAFTHADTLSHTNAFTHRRLYTQTLLHKRKRPSQFFLSF